MPLIESTFGASKDDMIEVLRFLIPQPLLQDIDNHFFISYKANESALAARRLSLALMERGFKVWFDKEEERELTVDVMEEGVGGAQVFVLVLSENIFKSGFVVAEVKRALEMGRTIKLVHLPQMYNVFLPGSEHLFQEFYERVPKEIVKVLGSGESHCLHENKAFMKVTVNYVLQKLQTM